MAGRELGELRDMISKTVVIRMIGSKFFVSLEGRCDYLLYFIVTSDSHIGTAFFVLVGFNEVVEIECLLRYLAMNRTCNSSE